MSKKLFEAGLVVSEEYMSFIAMKEGEIGWDIQSSQAESGTFHSTLQGVHTHNIQLGVHAYSTSMLFRGSYPAGTVLLYMFDAKALTCSFNDPVLKNEILVGFPNEEVDMIINSSSVVYTLAVEETCFREAFKDYFSTGFNEYMKDHTLLVPFEMLEELSHEFQAYLLELSKIDTDIMTEEDYSIIDMKILNTLFGYLYKQEKEAKRLKFDVTEIRKYLENNIESDISIKDVSQVLNISERQLHNAFKKNYGITPKRYLLILRLNAIYRDLKFSTSNDVTLSDIVYKYGFTHMSHFSKAFKKLFSKMPSEVLALDV